MNMKQLLPINFICTFILVSTLLLFTSSCKNASESKTEEVETIDNNLKYKLTPFSESTLYPDATLSLSSYKNGQFDFMVKSDNYELGAQTPDAEQKMCANSGKGQHIHLILDSDPYLAKYEATFTHEVTDGAHYMLAFLSRSYHESIKTNTSFIAQKVEVKDNSITAGEDIAGEMIFYSRPKGTYVGKANTDKVMLDFFLVNTELGADRKVKVEINGEVHLIDQWQPYYIEGMPMGKNTITLTLVDGNESALDVPNNPVSRDFELKADPSEDI